MSKYIISEYRRYDYEVDADSCYEAYKKHFGGANRNDKPVDVKKLRDRLRRMS